MNLNFTKTHIKKSNLFAYNFTKDPKTNLEIDWITDGKIVLRRSWAEITDEWADLANARVPVMVKGYCSSKGKRQLHYESVPSITQVLDSHVYNRFGRDKDLIEVRHTNFLKDSGTPTIKEKLRIFAVNDKKQRFLMINEKYASWAIANRNIFAFYKAQSDTLGPIIIKPRNNKDVIWALIMPVTFGHTNTNADDGNYRQLQDIGRGAFSDLELNNAHHTQNNNEDTIIVPTTL
jgi:hypothetical protein